MAKGNILLVDDDSGLLRLLTIRLEKNNYKVIPANDPNQAISLAKQHRPDLMITDLRMPGLDGLQLLERIQGMYPNLPIIIISAHGTIPDAVKAIQQGAFVFLTKPIDKDELLKQVDKAVRLSTDTRQTSGWRKHIITQSSIMEQLLADTYNIAQSNSNVLIVGQSGSGKELFAQAIHQASKRSEKNFVAINCAAIPENLLESELFGYTKGAFTGADKEHDGLIKSADLGTLFLDEIGDMPIHLQTKLLRVIQEKKVKAIGATREVDIDLRIISATHQNLEQLLEASKFREDLYYRLKVIQLNLPTLEQRREDIPLLVNHFLQSLADRDLDKKKLYTPEALELLCQAQWPGNVRQLFNIVEQNVALSNNKVITPNTVKRSLEKGSIEYPSLSEARDEFVRNYIIQLLQLTNGNVAKAARFADRNRTDFYKLLTKFSIEPNKFKHSLKDAS